jgi:uncharacterized membrane protein
MATIAQWIHVVAAVVALGGTGFLLFVLLPSAAVLSPEQSAALMKAVQGRFRWVSWSAVLLLIISGIYNVRLVWEVPWGRYWEFLTLKIVLAFVVFALVFALTMPFGFLRRIHQRRPLWTLVAFVLGVIVILISAYLRRG